LDNLSTIREKATAFGSMQAIGGMGCNSVHIRAARE
jgi:hypothetical protein